MPQPGDSRAWQFRRELFSQEPALHAEYLEAAGRAAQALAGVARRLERGAAGAPSPHSPAGLERDLRDVAERNRGLEVALQAAEARLQRSQRQYKDRKNDQKLLTEEVKDTYEAFLMAKKYYKKNLHFYYTIEPSNGKNQIVFIQFFTKERKKTDKDKFSLRIERNTETGKNELMELTPMLATFKAIKKRLSETNDVPGALCCIRQSFLNIRHGK